MKLTIKKEYLNRIVGGGKLKNINIADVKPEDYESLYNRGYSFIFDIKDEKKIIKEISDEKINDLDDTNK